jgi:hypothetical protein
MVFCVTFRLQVCYVFVFWLTRFFSKILSQCQSLFFSEKRISSRENGERLVSFFPESLLY